MITQERLKEVLYYGPDTGHFVWIVDHENIREGEIAGTIKDFGYIGIKIDGKVYAAHRLAWLYMTGSFPKDIIDHKDRNTSNNIFSNLRECNHSQNAANQDACNVRERNGRYQARVQAYGELITVGTYSSYDEAKQAAVNKKRELFGEFAP